tara:strand:- start:119 stop:961 length:843 start_codon:yes stop_codon:yes gene_type:complete
MEYLSGYTIKPSEITAVGEVRFTDGTNSNMGANQVTCEAYGYTYDKTSGTCISFRFNTNLNRNISNINNKNNGSGNTNQLGSNTIQINGTQNTTRGFNNNCLINGSNNEIANGINNSSVFGLKGEATATNSIVLGGNAHDDNLSERQSVQLMYGTQTTAGVTVDSYLNNTTDSYFPVPTDTIMYFHADVIAVRVGGTAEIGDVGDYASWVERGVVINKSGTLSIQRERDAIKSSGTVTDWRPVANVDGTNFVMTVRGETDTTIEWNSNITFTQIKTGVAL